MPEAQVDAARREFSAQLEDLRQTMSHKIGLRPRRSGWWLLLLGGAVGMALAGRTRKRRTPKKVR